ncbi:MAG TPA: PQQ-binding-like beta-propeller repeat protein [Candidatus Limnocylindrales bacterium]
MTSPRRRVTSQAHPRHARTSRPGVPVVGGAAIVVVAVLLGFVALSGSGGQAAGSPGASLRPSGSAAGSPIAGVSPSATIDATGSPVGPSGTPRPSASPVVEQGKAGRFGLGLLIADRGNGRLLIVNDAGKILWRFPATGSIPKGQQFSADDAFLAPDGKTIVANDEFHHVIDRIDIVTRKIVWQYGHYGQTGSAAGYLHVPDDAYPLANGNVTVADIRNCRVLEINQAKKIVRQWGRTRVCTHNPPATYDNPNGDTPLPGGGMLITEIGGSRVVRLNAAGGVVFDVHVPVAYPSDAQPDHQGNFTVVDYSTAGALLRFSRTGKVLWRYNPATARGRLDHPSLAITLPDGTIAVNDDFRHRIVIIDPATDRIVWQYGRTDLPGRAAGYLNTPDGMDLIPMGTRLN